MICLFGESNTKTINTDDVEGKEYIRALPLCRAPPLKKKGNQKKRTRERREEKTHHRCAQVFQIKKKTRVKTRREGKEKNVHTLDPSLLLCHSHSGCAVDCKGKTENQGRYPHCT